MKYIPDWAIHGPIENQQKGSKDNEDKHEHQPGVPFN